MTCIYTYLTSWNQNDRKKYFSAKKRHFEVYFYVFQFPPIYSWLISLRWVKAEDFRILKVVATVKIDKLASSNKFIKNFSRAKCSVPIALTWIALHFEYFVKIAFITFWMANGGMDSVRPYGGDTQGILKLIVAPSLVPNSKISHQTNSFFLSDWTIIYFMVMQIINNIIFIRVKRISRAKYHLTLVHYQFTDFEAKFLKDPKESCKLGI